MEGKVRFLSRNEYGKTLNGFVKAFDDTLDKEFMDEFYGDISEDGSCTGAINRNIIAAVELDGQLVTSAQCLFVKVMPRDKGHEAYYVPYIMGVCTLEEYRHRGYMDQVLTLMIDKLRADGYPWCFLLPVDTAIYRHLGFDTDWQLTDEELVHIYSDGDGLYTASAKRLNADYIEPVKIIGRKSD